MIRRSLAKRQSVAMTVILALTVLIMAGCGGDDSDSENVNSVPESIESSTGVIDTSSTAFLVMSADFTDGGDLPDSMACTDEGGRNISPQLSWQNAPRNTRAFAVVMDDENPPCGSGEDACRHWAVFNIPAGTSALEAGADLSQFSGVTQGENFKGDYDYAGPCPPERHTYQITVYALGEGMPDLPDGTKMTRSAFAESYSSFILAQSTISGSFSP